MNTVSLFRNMPLAFVREPSSLNGEDPPSQRYFGETRWSFAVDSPKGETEALATVEFRTEAPPSGRGASLEKAEPDRFGGADPLTRSSSGELLGVILFGSVHVILEIFSDGLEGSGGSIARPQHIFNVLAFIIWGLYLLWRFVTVKGMAAAWGFRREGFIPAIKAGGIFAILAMIPLLVYGVINSRFPLPATFWLVMILYPVWGLGQQFALQALITRNLRDAVPRLWPRLMAASVLFSASHFPNYWLMGLTLVAGIAFSWNYERYRNIWAVGIVHGILGAAAYYIVLGHDPGGELMELFR